MTVKEIEAGAGSPCTGLLLLSHKRIYDKIAHAADRLMPITEIRRHYGTIPTFTGISATNQAA